MPLGASRWQAAATMWCCHPDAEALLTGFALAFARAVGEYGSVIFIAGNIPMVSEITPLFIIAKLEQYDYAGATAMAVVMLLSRSSLLLVINGLQAWQTHRDADMAAQLTGCKGAAMTYERPTAATREPPGCAAPSLLTVAWASSRCSCCCPGGRVRRGAAQGPGHLLLGLWLDRMPCRR